MSALLPVVEGSFDCNPYFHGSPPRKELTLTQASPPTTTPMFCPLPIERLIGTMMGAVHLLPGTTQSSVAAKGSYDAEAMAIMTLGEFDSWFALEICRYNNSIHSSLGCTPVAKWEALSSEMTGCRLGRRGAAPWPRNIPPSHQASRPIPARSAGLE
jgi:hypothetical protein